MRRRRSRRLAQGYADTNGDGMPETWKTARYAAYFDNISDQPLAQGYADTWASKSS